MPDVRIAAAAAALLTLLVGCADTPQYKNPEQRYRQVWVKPDGSKATRAEFDPARDACAAAVRNDTRRASEAFASDVWAFEMRKCLEGKGFKLVEVPKETPSE